MAMTTEDYKGKIDVQRDYNDDMLFSDASKDSTGFLAIIREITHTDKRFSKFKYVSIVDGIGWQTDIANRFKDKSKQVLGAVALNEDDYDEVLIRQYGYTYVDKNIGIYGYVYGLEGSLRRFTFLFYNNEKHVLNLFEGKESVSILKPGLYEAQDSPFGVSFVRTTATDMVAPLLNDDYQKDILSDIQKFFESEEFYNKNGFTYRRGILMYGTAGTGKSSAIREIARKVHVPVIFINKKVDLDVTLKATMDMACPDGCIVVIEDIDGIDSYKRSELLNFLDGVCSPKKCYIIATTNFLDRLDFAFSRRPSRFDRLIKVDLPDERTRKEIIKLYFKDKVKDLNVDLLAKQTDGFTGAFIKELYLIYCLSGLSIEKALARLREHIQVAQKGTSAVEDDDNYLG